MKTEIIEDTTPKHMDGIYPALWKAGCGEIFFQGDSYHPAICIGAPKNYEIGDREACDTPKTNEWERITSPITIRFTP